MQIKFHFMEKKLIVIFKSKQKKFEGDLKIKLVLENYTYLTEIVK